MLQSLEELRSLHPVRDLKLNDMDFVSGFQRFERLEVPLKESKCHDCPKRDEHVTFPVALGA